MLESSIMRNLSFSIALILALAATASAKAARTITITGNEQMKYDVTKIQAKPGEQLHVVVKSEGSMPKIAMAHNFVLLKAGASPLEFTNAAMNARDTDFIPASMKDKVLANTGLAGGGETVEVTFKAPMKPGTYTYLCSFPGHFAVGMKGELVVK
jgi:azurin